ncbi:DUF4434 domain-containing protein [Thalassospira marina]|nr:DUF4434 domain-containing protein [Thalassospira marina]
MRIFRTLVITTALTMIALHPAAAQDVAEWDNQQVQNGQQSNGQALFYQPHETDANITPAQWNRIWQKTRENRFNTVIVQWTSYGDIDFGGKNGWLANSLKDARDQGLSLIMGLHMDPAYYNRLAEIDTAGTGAYLEHQLGLSLKQANTIRQDWGISIAGWYVPLELDDWNFEQKARRDIVNERLGGLASRLDLPVHVSAFSGGKLTPDAYAGWLGSLEKTGIHVWAQDGAGTRTLPAMARETYIKALPCDIGIVLEAFRQTSGKNEPFTAEPAKPNNGSVTCHPAAVFGLRYMAWGGDLRQAMQMHATPDAAAPENKSRP